jgi:hypothetical protein
MSIFIVVIPRSVPEHGGSEGFIAPDLQLGYFTDQTEAQKACEGRFSATVWEIKQNSGVRGQIHWKQKPFWGKVHE